MREQECLHSERKVLSPYFKWSEDTEKFARNCQVCLRAMPWEWTIFFFHFYMDKRKQKSKSCNILVPRGRGHFNQHQKQLISGKIQHRKSAIHRLPLTPCMLRKLVSLNTVMQRIANENAAGVRRIFKRSDHPKIERLENNNARLILRRKLKVIPLK